MGVLAEARPDEGGRWSFEGRLAPGDTVYVSVRAAGYTSWLSPPLVGDATSEGLEVRLVRFAAVGQAQAELHPELARAGVFGRIVDAATNQAISGARVAIAEGRETVTTPSGFFALDSVAPGLQVVRVQHLAYETREAVIRLGAGQAAELEVELTAEPLELDPIDVTVESSSRLRDMRGFEQRRETHFGRFYTRDEIEARGPRYLGDLLQDIAGVRMIRNHTPFDPFTLVMRGRECRPKNIKVWVDGVERFGRSGAIELENLLGVHLEAVEIYKMLEAPAEYYDPAERPCLTILVWTSRPGG